MAVCQLKRTLILAITLNFLSFSIVTLLCAANTTQWGRMISRVHLDILCTYLRIVCIFVLVLGMLYATLLIKKLQHDAVT